MKIKEIKCKTCLVKSKLTDYVINPYTGCSHSCRYCYADFIRRFQNIKERWGEFVFPKINCPDLLEKELEKAKPGHIWMSSVCDCYQPIEKKYQLTRKILEILIKYKDKFSIEILTKSSLVQRDFDLLKKLNVELGMSVGQMNSKIAKIFEPSASLPYERIETLKSAKSSGIKIFGFISPVIPGLDNLKNVFREMDKVGVDYVWVELFNMRKSAVDKILPIIKKEFPKKVDEFKWARENQDEWFNQVKRKVEELSKKYGVRVRGVVRHDLK